MGTLNYFDSRGKMLEKQFSHSESTINPWEPYYISPSKNWIIWYVLPGKTVSQNIANFSDTNSAQESLELDFIIFYGFIPIMTSSFLWFVPHTNRYMFDALPSHTYFSIEALFSRFLLDSSAESWNLENLAYTLRPQSIRKNLKVTILKKFSQFFRFLAQSCRFWRNCL